MGFRLASPIGSSAAITPPAWAGARIGLMGGSFNPAHAGHLRVAETALRRLNLDRVWWIVTPGNPLKSHTGLAPLAERMAHCRSLAAHPRMAVTAFEADLGTAYTAETIAFLKARYPATRFVWIMGADSLVSFHRWQKWREIAAAVPVAVIDRPGQRGRAMASKAAQALSRARVAEAAAGTLASRKTPAWTYLSTRLSPLSSTELRQRPRL